MDLELQKKYSEELQKTQRERNELKHQLEIFKKALEMACETIKEMLGDKPLYICGQAIAERLGIPMTSQIKDYDYFIDEAEKLIKGE